MQSTSQALAFTKGLPFSVVLEQKENGSRVFTDFVAGSYTFKAQFRASKSPSATLFATTTPTITGLGQIKLELTDAQTGLCSGTQLFYDVLAYSISELNSIPTKIFDGVVTLDTPFSVTQWENTPPVTIASPAAGTYNVDKSIVLGTNEAGSTTYYTTNGSVPTTSSTVYTGPIAITATTTLKYFSVDSAGNPETPQSSVYTIDKVAPITACSIANDATITTGDTITLTPDETASTYYTKNGSTPTTTTSATCFLYSTPFSLGAGANQTLKFFSVDTAGNSETVKTITNITVS